MQIFDFCKPSYALDKTDKYLNTTGLYLLKKMESIIPKSCDSLYFQLIDQKEKIFFNHPRAWHFVYTTKNLISDFSNNRDPSPEVINHLNIDYIHKTRVIELHLFNAVELAMIYSKEKKITTAFTINFKLPSQIYFPNIGNCLEHNFKSTNSIISCDPDLGILINKKNIKSELKSDKIIILPDDFSITFKDLKFQVSLNDPILNNPYFANGPIIKNKSNLKNWVKNYLLDAIELFEKLFPEDFSKILSLSSHYYFIHNSTNRFSSASSEKIPGIIYLPCINNVGHLAECILHENLHQLLFRIEKIIDIYNGGQIIEKYWSPWRDDPRPLRMIMHGVFVFAGVIDYWIRMIDIRNTSEDHYQLFLRSKQVQEGLKVLDKHANYSSAGKKLHRHLLKYVDSIPLDGVPRKIKNGINETLKKHREKIDNERYIGF